MTSSNTDAGLFAYDRLGDGQFVERFGLDFEQFCPGQIFVHRPGVTLSQQDNVDEALDTINSAMLHYDAAYAQQTQFERPLMVSTITVQRLFGMGWKTFARRARIVRIDSITLTKPVFGGDTLYAESEILQTVADGAEASSIQVAVSGIKADGERVARIVYWCKVWRAGHGPGQGGEQTGTPAQEQRFESHRRLPDGRLIEQTGLFFEDFTPGEWFLHTPSRSVLREEAITHALRSFDWNPVHHELDGEGNTAITQTWLLAMVTPLTTRTFGRVTANLAWTDVEFGAEVRAGDTLRAQSEVVEKRESKSRKEQGILMVATRATNQRGDEVLRFRRNLLVYRRDAAAVYGDANY